MTTQANLDYEEILDLFYICFENNQNSDELVSRIVASTGMTMAVVGKIQAEASMRFAKNCF